jgi:hypothetical protein
MGSKQATCEVRYAMSSASDQLSAISQKKKQLSPGHYHEFG